LVTAIAGLSFLGVSTFVQDLSYSDVLLIAATLSQIVCTRQERLA
jgi:ribose transport system permease protein